MKQKLDELSNKIHPYSYFYKIIFIVDQNISDKTFIKTFDTKKELDKFLENIGAEGQ